MNKAEFLQALRQSLRGLSAEEIENAIAYYEEYLSDAGEENEQQAIAQLGKPAAIAAQIRANAAMRNLKNEPNSAKKGISAAWLVVLAICASPIALPVAIAVLAIFFALFVSVGAVLFAFSVAAVTVVAAGIASLAISFVVIFSNIGAGIFGIGSSLVCTGLGLLFGILAILCARWGFRGIAFLFNRLTEKRRGKMEQ